MTKIAIDLSTREIGVAWEENDNGKISTKLVQLDTWSDKNLIDNVKVLKNALKCLIDTYESQEYLVGIELANYQNPQLTQRFSFYAGVIVSLFANENAKIKFFNSNAWQTLIGCEYNDDRDTRKNKAKMWVANYVGGINVSEISQDEIDAICILQHLEEVETTEQTKEKNKAKRKSKSDKEKIIFRAQQKIIKLYEKKEKLKKPTAIFNCDKEIEGLENLIRIWKKEK